MLLKIIIGINYSVKSCCVVLGIGIGVFLVGSTFDNLGFEDDYYLIATAYSIAGASGAKIGVNIAKKLEINPVITKSKTLFDKL